MLGPFGLHPKGTMRARALPAARALARRGHRVTLIMPPWQTPEDAGREWPDRVPGVDLVYADLQGLRLPLAGHILLAARMARRARALRPDVLHVFKPKAYGALAAELLGWLRPLSGGREGPALVVDTDDWEGAGGWNELEPYSPLQRRFFAWQERRMLRAADAVTVASRALETLAWSLGVAPERTRYLPNGVETEAAWGPGGVGGPTAGEDPGFPSDPQAGASTSTAAAVSPQPSPAHPARPPTILLYTRFFDFPLARPLDLLARLRDVRPDLRLLVLGQGLFGEERAFAEAARARGLAGAVELRGWVEPAALPAALREADLAIAPFADTLVNRCRSSAKLLELLDAGLPVVAEDVGQSREVIQDGRSGRLVPAGDLEAFAAAVLALLDDPAAAAALGRAGQARVRAIFAWARQAETLEAVYRDARARRGRLETGGAGRAIDGAEGEIGAAERPIGPEPGRGAAAEPGLEARP